MFRMVVLPEPLGPMSAWISPRRTSMSTPSTALRPPKCLARPLTASSTSPDRRAISSVAGSRGPPDSSGRRRLPRPAAPPSSRQFHQARSRRLTRQPFTRPAMPPGMKIMIEHDAGGVEHQVGVLQEPQDLRQQRQQGGADDGADRRAVPAQHRHRQQHHRLVEGEGVRADVVRAAVGEEPAAEAGVARREREGHHLEEGRVDAHRLGGHLVLPDGQEGAADARVLEPDGAPGEQDQGDGRHVEEGAGVLQLDGADPGRGILVMPSEPLVSQIALTRMSCRMIPKPIVAIAR